MHLPGIQMSLRTGLPLTLLLTLGLIIGASLLNTLWQQQQALEEEAVADLVAEAGRLARLAERELQRAPASVESALTHLSTDHRVSAALLIDAHGTIRMAHRLAWRGETAAEAMPGLDYLESPVVESRKPHLVFSEDRRQMGVWMAFYADDGETTGRALEHGLIHVAYDLTQALQAGRQAALRARLPDILATIGLVLLLGLWLNRAVFRPLSALEQASGRLGRGAHAPSGEQRSAPPPKLPGTRPQDAVPGEIASLARAFSAMEQRIHTTVAALRESEAQYRNLFDAHPLPLWVYDLESLRFLAVNLAAVTHYGYSREQFLAMKLTDIRPPEDIPALLDNIRSRRTGSAGIWRHVCADGHPIQVEVIAHRLEWQGCRAELVMALDVTERERTAENLRLAAAAFETSEAITVTDRSGRILRINQAFTRITGYSAEEAVGQNHKLLKSGRHDAAFYRAFWKSLRQSGHWEGEIWNRRKNGSVFPQWLSIRAVTNSAGEITHYVSNFFDLSERKEAEATIHRLSSRDPLTDLPNRSLFRDRLSQEFASSRRAGHYGAVLQLDIDRFKAVNDARGHAVGDELLRRIALRLRESIREGDTVARLGADEFAVLLCDLPRSEQAAARHAHQVAEKLRSLLERPFHVDERAYHLVASVGITLFPKQTQSESDDVLREADTALYRAKEAGRNTVRFFENSMSEEARIRFELENELRKAVDNNELRLYLQPQVDCDGKVLAAEALVRWQHPERGLVPPGAFIPIAEESGLILPLGDWVLRQCCRLLSRPEVDRLGLRIAVNVSPRQFRQPDFVPRLRTLLNATGTDPTRLTMEVTEGLMLEDIGDTIAKMNELADIGMHFSIDDFGTGYSSLAYLKRLPIHELKIDRTFVQDAPTDPNDAALVDAILAMAGHLNLQVVAEGVETEAQARFLRQRGCTLFQGYLTGRPEPATELLARWLEGGGT